MVKIKKEKTHIKQNDRGRVSSWMPWVVWICGALFYAYQFCLRVSPSVMADGIASSFQVDACALGVLSSVYYYSYSALQIPAGILYDRFGPRRVLLTAIALCGIGAALFGVASSLFGASIGRLLMGVGSAFAFLGCVKISSTWFPADRLSFVIGCTIFVGTMGAIGGGAPLAWLVGEVGWRPSLNILALVTIGLCVLGWLFVRDSAPGQNLDKPQERSRESISVVQSLITIFSNPQTWILGFYGLLMYVPLAVFPDLWGVPFLVDTYGMDKTQAAGIGSLFYVGMGAFSPFVVVLLRLFKSYRVFLGACAIVMTGLSSLLVFGHVPVGVPLSVLVTLIGVASAGQFLAFAVVCEVNPSHLTATSSGIQNMICMFSGVIFQPVVGWLLEYTAVGGVRHYEWAFWVIPVATSLALILSFYIKETYHLEQERSKHYQNDV